MFPRPEVIPLQRMIRQTALERLHQMREESPYANAAETLLGCLVIFPGRFSKKALHALAPQDMDIPTRNAAFSTLRTYNLAQRVSQRRYSVPASLKPLFPITEDMRARHWAYVSTLAGGHSYLYNRIIKHWPDLSLALIWGLEHETDAALELCKIISDYQHIFLIRRYWHKLLLPSMRAAALKTQQLALRAYVFWQLGVQVHRGKKFIWADTWYGHATALYAQVNTEIGYSLVLVHRARLEHSLVLMHRASLAHERGLIPEARLYYRQSFEVHPEEGPERNHILWLLFQMEAQEKNLEEAIAVFDTSYAQLWTGNQIKAGYLLGKLFHHHNRPAEARSAFARAVDIYTQSPAIGPDLGFSNVLRAWGEMEHELGHHQAGRNLCQQARVHLYYLDEDVRSFVQEIDEIEVVIAAMGCDGE